LILLDTHVVVWLGFEESRLSPKAAAAIVHARQTAADLAISDVTLLELANLAVKQRITLSTSLQTYLEDVEKRFAVLPISARASARAAELPASFPRDPADRIIAATAIVEGLPLITADAAIRRSKVLQTIW
jgi:PIN domain nuclease of toxin-antitoxin system